MKKSDFTRSTVECGFSSLRPKFIEYMRKYIEEHKLENIEKEVLHCFQTTNLKKGFLGKIKTSYTDICITTRFLFWAIIDEKETGVAAAQWSDISEIWDWEATESGKMIEDSGVELFGFIYLWSKRGRWFIGLGNDIAGKKCRELLKEAIGKK
jgi:hypothetical protein